VYLRLVSNIETFDKFILNNDNNLVILRKILELTFMHLCQSFDVDCQFCVVKQDNLIAVVSPELVTSVKRDPISHSFLDIIIITINCTM